MGDFEPVYRWLVAEGLWPSALGALLYWAIPVVVGAIVSVRTLKRVYHELTGLWRQHIAVQQQQAQHLATLAARYDPRATKEAR